MRQPAFIHPARRAAIVLGTIAVLVPALLSAGGSVSGCGAGGETETDDAPPRGVHPWALW
jgi:hypothetical protein